MNFMHTESILSCNLLDDSPLDMDKRMNDAGLLSLMVSDPLAMNMSNTLGYLRGELKGSEKKKRVSFRKGVVELGFIKKILLAVYNRIFSWYYS